MANTLDETDVKILELLQKEGRMQRNELAEEIGLSISAASERMRKLEERGVIKGYEAIVDPKRLRLDITAFLRLSVQGSQNYSDVVDRLTDMEQVLEVHSVTGEGSHLLKVRVRNTTMLERLLSEVQSIPGVVQTTTSIVLSTFEETREVPAEPVEIYEYEEEDG